MSFLLNSVVDENVRDINKLLDKNLLSLGRYSITASDLIIIFVIFIITKIFLAIVKKTLNLRLGHKAFSGRASSVFQLVQYIAWIIAISLMLDTMGIKITILLAGSAALLVGLGLGLQQIFQDIVSGIFILAERNIKIGDVMEFGNNVGIVKKIGLRTSTIYTRNGIDIIVPNHKFIVEDVINWSSDEVITHFKVQVGVNYNCDVQLVKNTLLEVAAKNNDIVQSDEKKKPFVRLSDFGDSALIFELHFWSNNIFYIEGTRSDIRFAILDAFNAKNINIPVPQQEVRILKNNTGLD